MEIALCKISSIWASKMEDIEIVYMYGFSINLVEQSLRTNLAGI